MTGRRKNKGKDLSDAEDQGVETRENPKCEAWCEEAGKHAVGQVKLGDFVAETKNRHGRKHCVAEGQVAEKKNWHDRKHCVAESRVASGIAHPSPTVAEDLKGDTTVGENDTRTTEDLLHDSKIAEQGREVENLVLPQLGEKSLLARLRTVSEAFEEPFLSQEALESNLQEQADEILALESIYGEDFMRLDDEHIKTPTFVIWVNVEISESLTVVAERSSLSNLREPQDSLSTIDIPKASTSGNLQLYTKHSFTVQALPPIQLVFTLPRSYPSHSQPLFTIQALWLNPVNLSKFCTALDRVWDVQQGQVVLYSWIDWLQNQSLSFLDMSEKLMLGPYGIDGTMIKGGECNIRAVSACCSFDSDICHLLQFNEERKEEEFRKSLHMCTICFTEQTGKEFAKMPCQHMFCWSCMQTYASVHVKEGSVHKLNCPDTACKGSIPPYILKQALDEDSFERWDKLVLQRSLDGMEDIVYCPRCERVCIEEKDHFVQCGGCFFSFCSLCRQTWHVGQECVSPEARLLILQGRQKGGSRDQQKKQEEMLLNELMNLQYVRREAKQCPKCKMAISKTEGCNKMVCSNCGQYFCFRCGKAIDGYDHFQEGSCRLFEEEEIRRWQPQMDMQEQQAQIEIQLELWPERGRPCPNCRMATIIIFIAGLVKVITVPFVTMLSGGLQSTMGLVPTSVANTQLIEMTGKSGTRSAKPGQVPYELGDAYAPACLANNLGCFQGR